MKSELEQQDIEAIAREVIEMVKPLLDNRHIRVEDEFLTMDEATQFLKVSKEQIYQWVSNSKHGLNSFPYKKLGKQLRFSKKELIDWMDKNKFG